MCLIASNVLKMKLHLKAQLSFSSGDPLEVTSIASRNSLKSIVPFLSESNVLGQSEVSTVSANHSSPEHVCAELLRVAAREALAVDLDEHGRTQLPLGAVLHEALVPLLDGVLPNQS